MKYAQKDQPLPLLAVAAAVVGLLTGVVACLFRICLEHADALRFTFVQWAHRFGALGAIVVILACSILVWGAAMMVYKLERTAEGSGIPRVEAVVRGDLSPSRMRLLPIKFLGGVMAIGGGLTLGREGPSVHMGGNIAYSLTRYWRMSKTDLLTLIAAGAAAGLTSAFSAPLAGAVFVLEELVRKFNERTTIAVLFSTGASFLVVHRFFGNNVVFAMLPVPESVVLHAPAVALVGIVCALVAVLYNKAILWLLGVVDASRFSPPTLAAIIGAGVGLVAFFFPHMVGGGDAATKDALTGATTLTGALVVLGARFALVTVSYAARTPGGLFAPMLVLGSQVGVITALSVNAVWPSANLSPASCAVIGMGAFFAASVQAPVTGLVLAAEMTGQTVLLPPLLGACAVSMAMARYLKSQPIYTALAHRTASVAHWRERWVRIKQRWARQSGSSDASGTESER